MPGFDQIFYSTVRNLESGLCTEIAKTPDDYQALAEIAVAISGMSQRDLLGEVRRYLSTDAESLGKDLRRLYAQHFEVPAFDAQLAGPQTNQWVDLLASQYRKELVRLCAVYSYVIQDIGGLQGRVGEEHGFNPGGTLRFPSHSTVSHLVNSFVTSCGAYARRGTLLDVVSWSDIADMATRLYSEHYRSSYEKVQGASLTDMRRTEAVFRLLGCVAQNNGERLMELPEFPERCIANARALFALTELLRYRRRAAPSGDATWELVMALESVRACWMKPSLKKPS